MHIKVLKGDITKLKVDAIVNPARNSLLGGGGVDGAIHRAAGPELLTECSTLNGCWTGHAKITMGYRLPAKYVIHTVGPVWRGGTQNEPKLLANCYRNSLRIAKEIGLKSVAFPPISMGIYAYPKEPAAEIAVRTIIEEIKDAGEDFEVWLVAFDDETEALYNQTVQYEIDRVHDEEWKE